MNSRRAYFIFLIKHCVLLLNLAISQTSPPELISYQGIARDAAGNVLSGQQIGINFIIHQYTPNGTPVFAAAHTTTTNAVGLFTLAIGSVNTASFQAIDWSKGPYFLEVELDPTGTGTSYTSIGTQQILSVPYALYSKKSETTENVVNTGTATAWNTQGNYQTDSIMNFLGTIDNFPLIFRTSNMERMRITQTGKIRIGNTTIPPKALVSVFGSLNDTVLAHFSNTNSSASILDVYNLGGYAGVTMRSGTINQDTGFIGMKNNDGLLIYSTKKTNMFNKDSLKMYSDNSVALGANHNFNIFTKNDTIHLWGRTMLSYSALLNTPTDNAMTINFGNAQSYGAAGLKVNHYNSSVNSSFGIYINSSGSTSSGPLVGLGSYITTNSGSTKKSIESYVSGTGGPNIALFLQSDTGTVMLDGYTNWAIYSNGGNIMFRDGHIVSNYNSNNFHPVITYTSTGGTLSASLGLYATDTKGIINYNIGSTAIGNITVTFGTPYSHNPTVVFSNSGDANVKLVSVSTTGFILQVYQPGVAPTSGEIHYIVIE
ncbi:MAG: hypothetical protein AB1304_05240 [Bacteroidota bacterium]